MISWLKRPIAQTTTRAMRARFYLIALGLVAASVPFLHLYMEVQLSFTELFIHTLNITLSTAVAILLLELVVSVYLKRETKKWSISFGLFWLLLFGVFLLSFIVMNVTHDLLPVTLDIWNRHIKHDLGAIPWKIVPVALLIGFILILLIRRYKIAQELTDLKKLNEKLQAAKSNSTPPNNEVEENHGPNEVMLALPYKGNSLYLDPAFIIRVESNENYCHVFTAPENDQTSHSYMARITLNKVANQLPEKLFLQVHKSHIVNFSYVSSLVRQGRGYQLQLTNGDHIPVSRSRIKQTRQQVLLHCHDPGAIRDSFTHQENRNHHF